MLNRKTIAFVIIGLISFTILLSSIINNSVNRKNLEAEGIKTNINENKAGDDGSKPAGGEVKSNEPLKSGQITTVPWVNDKEFKQARTESQATVQLAAYRTVLRDPLPGEENNVHLGAGLLKGTVLNPGQTFSQNASIGPYSQSRGFEKGPVYLGSQLSTTIGGGVCKIASTLYNVAVLSNLPIVERYSHGMPVPYVPYGQDATVSYGAKDLKFMNNRSFPILIWAEGIDNTLYIAFYGKVKPPKVQWHHTVLKKIETNKIYRTNPSLPEGTEKVVVEGMDGAVIRSWVTIDTPGGTSQVKSLGKSYYNPMPYIIEKGASTAATSNR